MWKKCRGDLGGMLSVKCFLVASYGDTAEPCFVQSAATASEKCGRPKSMLRFFLRETFHPDCPLFPSPKSGCRVHRDRRLIRGIDGENQSLALVLRGEPLGLLRELAAKPLLAESRRHADVDELHRVMRGVPGEKEAAGMFAEGIRRGAFQNEPPFRPELADVLIAGDDVERFAEAVERRTVLCADVGLVDERRQIGFLSRVERVEEEAGKCRRNRGKLLRLAGHVKQVRRILVAGGGE